jgi:hypothetical protein
VGSGFYIKEKRKRFIRIKGTNYKTIFPHKKRMVTRSFRDDWREAYVISDSYGMGNPLASRFNEAGRTAEGGGITHCNCLK